MKHAKHIASASLILAFIACPAALANEAQKAPPGQNQAAVMAKYDKDHNGVLNVDEGRIIREDFAKNPNDPLLKPYDTNHDGILSDDEVAKIKPAPVTPSKPKPKPKPKKK